MAQAPREKSAQKEITRQRWNKALSSLQKSIEKDPASAPAYYVLSTWYFVPANPAFNVDSAYSNICRALTLWGSGDSRSRSHWSRLPLDSLMLVDMLEQVDSAAFEQARRTNTESGYTTFIETHPQAKQHQSAIDLRFGVAYEAAVEMNTIESFGNFLTRYPDSPQAVAARAKYDELSFRAATRDGLVGSYELFLKDHPTTPYRPVAERAIFEIVTAKGRPGNFIEFLKKYPDSHLKKKATDILYHLMQERNEPFPAEFATDSIAGLHSLERDYVVPILVKEKFGLMNSSGKVVLAPAFDEIDDSYLCGDIMEDVIVLPGRMVNRRGYTLMEGNVTGIEDAGYGFLNVQIDNRGIVFHKSGFRLGDFPVDEFKVLNGQLLGVRSSGKWGVFTLAGKPLLPFGYNGLENFGEFLVLQTESGSMLTTLDTLAAAGQDSPFLAGPFDEVKRLGTNVIVVKDELNSWWNERLVQYIHPGRHTITPASFGAVLQTDSGAYTYNRYGESSERFQRVNVVDSWVAAKSAEGWVLYNPEQRINLSIPYDTLSLFGPFAIGKKQHGYELNLFLKPDKLVTINEADSFEFLPGKDSLSYLVAITGSKRTVYDTYGNVLFTLSTVYDKMETAGMGYFIVTKKDKKGLINSQGKVVVPVQYDAVGSAVNGMISLLKGVKFGAFDVNYKVLFPASYDKNVQRFDRNFVIAYRDGAYGFVDNKNKISGTFSFGDVQPWKDSVAIVRQGGRYQFYNVYSRASELSGITHIKTIRNEKADKLLVVNKDGLFGVVSNRTGIVIPINFSDIVNIGSAEVPMYFTEKHVEEASIFVVIYYDSHGKMVRREVYEPDEYERIYCDKK